MPELSESSIVHSCSLQVLGGTSVMNGMMYIRGSRADYDSWAAAGNEGWSYEDVLPYFMKSEDNKQVHHTHRQSILLPLVLSWS